MAYSNLELLRKEIADSFKYAFDTQVGDGETSTFKLSHGNVKDYVVYINGDEKTEETDYTIDKERGILTFTDIPIDGAEIEVKYYYSAFSDEELTEFLTLENNNVIRAALRCIDILLVDSSRCFDYASGQTEMKPSQVFNQLKEVRKIFRQKIGESNSQMRIINRSSPFYKHRRYVETDLSRKD